MYSKSWEVTKDSVQHSLSLYIYVCDYLTKHDTISKLIIAPHTPYAHYNWLMFIKHPPQMRAAMVTHPFSK
jgi:hypothetical protein